MSVDFCTMGIFSFSDSCKFFWHSIILGIEVMTRYFKVNTNYNIYNGEIFVGGLEGLDRDWI